MSKKIDVKNLYSRSEEDKKFDPMGMYTGMPNEDFSDMPQQDADDL